MKYALEFALQLRPGNPGSEEWTSIVPPLDELMITGTVKQNSGKLISEAKINEFRKGTTVSLREMSAEEKAEILNKVLRQKDVILVMTVFLFFALFVRIFTPSWWYTYPLTSKGEILVEERTSIASAVDLALEFDLENPGKLASEAKIKEFFKGTRFNLLK
eukprot:m.269537 g.269537  ORF g.269537 m.269537 type:complete len:161 (+) comp40539_c1_seq26:1666-2148(+)